MKERYGELEEKGFALNEIARSVRETYGLVNNSLITDYYNQYSLNNKFLKNYAIKRGILYFSQGDYNRGLYELYKMSLWSKKNIFEYEEIDTLIGICFDMKRAH